MRDTPEPTRPLLRFAAHCGAGAVVGLAWAAGLLWFDVGGLGRLVLADPASLPVFLAGGVLAFMPAVLPAAIGALAPPDPVRLPRGWPRQSRRNRRSR